jgi:hypothetical protein
VAEVSLSVFSAQSNGCVSGGMSDREERITITTRKSDATKTWQRVPGVGFEGRLARKPLLLGVLYRRIIAALHESSGDWPASEWRFYPEIA